jgi:hypothetical protein
MDNYNYNIGLSAFEKATKYTFSTPKGSFCRWGVDKIDYYYKNEVVTVNYWKSLTVRSVISCAMPIFAFLDIFKFAGKALFKIITLHPKDMLCALGDCVKSIQLFLTTFLATPFALASSKSVYRSERMWNDKQKENLIRSLKNKFKEHNEKEPTKEKENLRCLLQSVGNEAVYHKQSKETFEKVVEMIVQEYPEQQSNSEVISDAYFELFSDMIVSASSKNIEIDPENKNQQALIQEVVKLRAPEFRLHLISDVLESIHSEPQYFEGLSELENSSHVIPHYLFNHITTNPSLQEGFKSFLDSRGMKDKTRRQKLINNLHAMVTSDISKKDKERMLKYFIACHTRDEKDTEVNKQIAAFDKQLGRERKKLKKAKNDKNKKSSIQSTIEDLQKQKEELGSVNKISHIDLAMKNLSIILFLDADNIVEILDQLDSGEVYSILSDEKIITSLYTKLFDLNEEEQTKLGEVWKLRAPWALIKFHLRLLEYPGKKHDEILKTEKEVFLSILNGNYEEMRYDTHNNPHLEKVFSYNESLENKWRIPPTLKIKGLLEKPHTRYQNYQVMALKDPTDVLLIGNDMKTCVNLSGRVERVTGLLGYIRDGRTHQLAIKSSDTSPSVATARLQVFWNEKTEKPVLYLDQVIYRGDDEEAYDLEKAFYAYAKKYAEDLGLDIVTRWESEDPKTSCLGKSYPGTLKCLGSSSPVEYVNVYHENRSAPFVIRDLYYLR